MQGYLYGDNFVNEKKQKLEDCDGVHEVCPNKFVLVWPVDKWDKSPILISMDLLIDVLPERLLDVSWFGSK